MANPNRISDKERKQMLADYVELGSYNAVGRKHGRSPHTVKQIVQGSEDVARLCRQKREANTQDMLAYMDSRRGKAQDFLDACLELMPEKLQKATLREIATAYGIVIDKYCQVKPQADREVTINVMGGGGLDD